MQTETGALVLHTHPLWELSQPHVPLGYINRSIQMSLASEQIVIHWFLSKGQKLPLNVYILTGPHVPPADVTVVWPMPDPVPDMNNPINQACRQTFDINRLKLRSKTKLYTFSTSGGHVWRLLKQGNELCAARSSKGCASAAKCEISY